MVRHLSPSDEIVEISDGKTATATNNGNGSTESGSENEAEYVAKRPCQKLRVRLLI